MFILASAKSLKTVKREPGESLPKWNAIEVFVQFFCTDLEVGRPFWMTMNAVELFLFSSIPSFSIFSFPFSAAIFGAMAAVDLSFLFINFSIA